jgi:hypothetical protein
MLDTATTIFMQARPWFEGWCEKQSTGRFKQVQREHNRVMVCVVETSHGQVGFTHESKPSVGMHAHTVSVVYPRDLYQAVTADLEERFGNRNFKSGWYVTIDERKAKLLSFVRSTDRAELTIEQREDPEKGGAK